jgi:hypothetical protein
MGGWRLTPVTSDSLSIKYEGLHGANIFVFVLRSIFVDFDNTRQAPHISFGLRLDFDFSFRRRKRFVFAHFEKHKRLPSWLLECGDIGKPIKAPTHHTFNFVEPKTNIMLTGDPDAVFQAKGGSLSILDYKTAKFTKTQDELLPIYVTQLNAYGCIAEHIGRGRVKHLALVYCEPKTEVDTSCIDAISAYQGFLLEFLAKILPIELNLESIPPLLARVRQFGDIATAPKGRNDCKDCKLLGGLVEAAAGEK